MIAIRDNKLLWAVKAVAAFFQGTSTYFTFISIFKNSDTTRPDWFIYVSAFLASILIDVFVLWVLYILETKTIAPIDRLSWVLTAILLIIAIIIIGIYDEGFVGWMPRIGFIGLVCSDILSWLVEFINAYFSREAKEQRMNNRKVIKRRQIMYKAWKKAMKNLDKEIVQLQIKREKEALNMTEVIKVEKIRETNIDLKWTCKKCKQTLSTTKAGQPFKNERALKIAIGRHKC